MSLARAKKLRILYLLALFQLVAGPLVLLQFSLFCKIAAPELPRHGIVTSLQKAWQSDDFQAALDHTPAVAKKESKAPLPTSDPKEKSAKAQMPLGLWKAAPLRDIAANGLVRCSDWARIWTPVWPQAPPGPPPRVG